MVRVEAASKEIVQERHCVSSPFHNRELILALLLGVMLEDHCVGRYTWKFQWDLYHYHTNLSVWFG